MKMTGTLLFFLNAFACRTSDTKDDTLDNDGDGYESSEDCNDNDSTMPEFDQDCDGISSDLDCDDQDETSTSVLTDGDCDGVLTAEDCDDRNPDSTTLSEDADCDTVSTDEDCDDNDSTIGSSITDQDCDGFTTDEDCDDNDSSSTIVSTDQDCDGTETDDDCDDNDPNVSNTTEYSFTENFNQGTNKTDIILAVDTSCSMDDDIYNLKATFSTFVDELNTNGQDFHIAAVVNDNGCVNGSVTHIDNTFSSSDASSAFDDMIVSSTYASNAERPFMLMESFLSESVDSAGVPLSSGCNFGAARENAKLALLGVTDEPDQSVQPYTHYVSEFQSLKSNPDNVIFHSLGGLCHNGGNTGVENAAVDTGGAIYDICTVVDAASATNFWTDFATEILTFESNGIFELNPEAASATDFTVTVNGQAQNAGWTFDSATNSLVFSGNYMPPSDAVIEVTYSWSECL